MTNDDKRKAALDEIRLNIAQHGFHIYVVTGGGDPLYGYTIGLSQSLGVELVFAGAYFYGLDDVPKIIGSIVADLKPPVAWEAGKINRASWGLFSFSKVHMSWATTLMLGALDFYQVKEIQAFQIVPEATHWTLDIPDLSEPWSPTKAPAWRWLHEEWAYPVPSKSVAITNLGALRGERITEVMRWEEDEWEIFAGVGPDVPQEERRVVPLGVLLAADESLLPAVNLPIGAGFWRDSVSEWHPWGSSGEDEKGQNRLGTIW
jgi:Domain of unknown function (DUF4262)